MRFGNLHNFTWRKQQQQQRQYNFVYHLWSQFQATIGTVIIHFCFGMPYHFCFSLHFFPFIEYVFSVIYLQSFHMTQKPTPNKHWYDV